MTLSMQSDRRLVRAAGRSVRHVLLTITAPDGTPDRVRDPINVAFVLDRSGSMEGGKFDLARQAVEHALKLLRERDRFSVVVYDDHIDVLTRAAHATAAARADAVRKLSRVDPRGTTDLSTGWLRGSEQVAETLQPGELARVLLLTDGLANRGIVDREELASLASGLRARGIATTAFGVGADFDERLLRAMARAGRGNYYFIDDVEAIPGYFASELGEQLEIVSRDATLVLRLPAGVKARLLHAFPARQQGSDLQIMLGDLAARQEIELAVRLTFPEGAAGEEIAVTAELSDRGGAHEVASLAWAFESHARNDAQPRNRTVDRPVARVYAALAREQATELNREGRYTEARDCLRRTAERIRAYAEGDRELQALVSGLMALAEELTVQQDATSLKEMHYLASTYLTSREPRGMARRRPRL